MLTLHSPEHHSSLYIIHMLTFPGIMVQFHHFKYSAPLNENSKMHYEKLFTHVESHTSTMSLLDSCEWHYIKAITSTTRQRDAHLLAWRLHQADQVPCHGHDGRRHKHPDTGQASTHLTDCFLHVIRLSELQGAWGHHLWVIDKVKKKKKTLHNLVPNNKIPCWLIACWLVDW